MLKPLNNKVIVKRLTAPEKSAGGIFIPDTAKEKPIEATVVEVGQGRLLKGGGFSPPQVKPGDHVFIAKWMGTEVTQDGEDYLVINEEEILAVVIP
jgi:chaperonin GroES